jgi:threonine dehydrogenase-like Zn-dependent dehydrogenase
MKMSVVTGPGKAEVIDAERPQAGPNDVLVAMRACGICGSDAFYVTIGGIPPRQGHTPLGHEPAGEVVEVGDQVSGIAVGDQRRHQPDGSTKRHHRQRGTGRCARGLPAY